MGAVRAVLVATLLSLARWSSFKRSIFTARVKVSSGLCVGDDIGGVGEAWVETVK